MSWATTILFGWMHALLQAIYAPVAKADRKDEDWGTKLMSFFPGNYPLKETMPFPVPKIAICMNSNNPPLKVVEKLESFGFSLQQMKNVKTPVYTKDFPTLEEAVAVMTIPNINTDFRPPYGYVTPNAIGPLFRLLIAVSAITGALRKILGSGHGLNFMVDFNLVKDSDNDEQEVEMEEGEERETFMERAKKRLAEGELMDYTNDIRFDVDASKFNDPKYVCWGPIEFRPSKVGGVLCPFEPNYSQPDVGAIGMFLSKFSKCLCPDDENMTENLQGIAYYWVREIHTTLIGEYLAHLLKALDLCEQLKTFMYPLFRPGGHYDGVILYGNSIRFRKVGEELVESLGVSDLDKELAAFGFHGVLLEKIVVRCSIVTPVEQIKTMRQLQRLVMAGGSPDGAVRNEVSKYLPRLAFAEKPEGINASSLKKVFDLLTSDAPIPDQLFLHYEEFWTEDRTKSILSCFGTMVPSFHVGNQKILACATAGKNAQGAKEYNSAKPPCLQVKSIPLASSALHWESMMNGGWIMTSNQQVPGGRVFRSQEGVNVWGMLGKFLATTVARYGEKTQTLVASQAESRGQKRKPDDDAEGREAKRAELSFAGIKTMKWTDW